MSPPVAYWQVSLERVYDTRRSAAASLFVMNCCDRQAVPQKLIQRCTRVSGMLEKAMKVKLVDSMADGEEMIVDTELHEV